MSTIKNPTGPPRKERPGDANHRAKRQAASKRPLLDDTLAPRSAASHETEGV
jgi:hypothetical protein